MQNMPSAKNEPKINYQKELEKILTKLSLEKKTPSLLLHSCCAPCSSYVIEYLSQYFNITLFYYNPNIYPEEEYHLRAEEQKNFIEKFPAKNPVKFLEGEFEKELFYQTVKGLEDVPEGGERCFLCYELRLRRSAETAKKLGLDYFTTTLSISPLKNAAKLNQIGLKLEEAYSVKYLPSDFKKNNGYKRSVELSARYQMYRQDYCGCIFSKREREEAKL